MSALLRTVPPVPQAQGRHRADTCRCERSIDTDDAPRQAAIRFAVS